MKVNHFIIMLKFIDAGFNALFFFFSTHKKIGGGGGGGGHSCIC